MRAATEQRAVLFMLTFVALWAAVEDLGGRMHRVYSPYQVVWTRYVVHLALMIGFFAGRNVSRLWHTKRLAYQFARSLLMVAMPASLIVAYQRSVSPAMVLSIFWLSPLLILTFAALLLGERPRLALWAGTTVACAGAFVLVWRGGAPPWPVLAYPLAMALSFSLYIPMTRSLRSETTTANLFYTAFGVAVVLSPFMPGLWVMPTPHDLVVMVAIGGLGLIALWALDRMAAAASVSLSAPFATAQVAFTVAINWLLHRQPPGVRAVAGLVLITIALVWLSTLEPAALVQDPA